VQFALESQHYRVLRVAFMLSSFLLARDSAQRYACYLALHCEPYCYSIAPTSYIFRAMFVALVGSLLIMSWRIVSSLLAFCEPALVSS
jgi:hypothetical protein